MRTNASRGFFRLWVALSVLWMVGAGNTFWPKHTEHERQIRVGIMDARIERNLAKMRSLGAPQEDIEAYLREQGIYPSPKAALSTSAWGWVRPTKSVINSDYFSKDARKEELMAVYEVEDSDGSRFKVEVPEDTTSENLERWLNTLDGEALKRTIKQAKERPINIHNYEEETKRLEAEHYQSQVVTFLISVLSFPMSTFLLGIGIRWIWRGFRPIEG